MTIDEELGLLEESIRRLKIEYDVYFGGGSKKPPTDTEWRVNSLLKKFSDSGRLTYAQRFRYNSLAQKYALYGDLWRQKSKIKEEGYRRPQDAVLGITGLRVVDDEPSPRHAGRAVTVLASGGDDESSSVRGLFDAMFHARKRAGLPNTGNFESFQTFVRHKTQQIQQQYGCQAVEYTVEVQEGQVKLKAKARN